MNIFKKRILHIVVAVLSLISMILIVSVPMYEYITKYYYWKGYEFSEKIRTSYLLIEDGPGIVSFCTLIPIFVLSILYQFSFMNKIPFVGRKLIAGLTYIIGGVVFLFASAQIMIESEDFQFALFFLFISSIVISTFGFLYILTKKPRNKNTVYQNPQPDAQVYQSPQLGEPVVPQDQVEGLYYELKGAQKILRLYDDRVTLEIIKNARAVFTQTWFSGTKEIYYADMLGIQYKESTNMILGYLQFETASNRGGDNFGSENSWTYDFRTIPNEKAKEVEHFVRNKMKEAKKPQIVQQVSEFSVADELLKWKNLLDSGVITQEEFDAKKSELLNK